MHDTALPCSQACTPKDARMRRWMVDPGITPDTSGRATDKSVQEDSPEATPPTQVHDQDSLQDTIIA